MRALIAGGFLGVEPTIQVVAEFFAQHRDPLFFAGQPQPIAVEVDRASAKCIGPCSPWHHGTIEYFDGWQGLEIPCCPFTDQPLERFWFPREPQGCLGGGAQGAVDRPLAESEPPGLEQS